MFVEKDFPIDVREKLTAMGYKIVERGSIGKTEIIQMDTKDKLVTDKNSRGGHKIIKSTKLIAVADKRGDDDARGF